jgi:hypothetical protein
MNVPAQVRRNLGWVAFILVMLAEFTLFDQHGAHYVTRVLPRWNDQIQYLSEAYKGYETLHTQGLAAGLRQTLAEPTSQGTLHDFWAMLLFSLVGPSRSAALALNMLFFLAWQAALFLAVRRCLGSRALAWSAVALLAALQLPWLYAPGSATDFRLDFMAACMFGICCCTCYLSEGFTRRGWSLVFGLTVGLCFGTRFITGTYFLLIYPALFAWILLTPQRRQGVRNLVFAGLATFLLVGPLFYWNREQMMDYYYYGHLVGPESVIRNTAPSLGDSLAWIGRTFWHFDLGVMWQGLAFIGTLGYLACLVLGETTTPGDGQGPLAPALIFLCCPALVLALHPQKSDVVLSILLPGTLLLLLCVWRSFIARLKGPGVVAVTLLVTLLGFGLFAFNQLNDPVPPDVVTDSRVAKAICRRITRSSQLAGLANPRIGVDHITDQIDAQIFRVLSYEHEHRWIPFEMTLPASIDRLPPRELEERIRNSDFFLITEPPYPPTNWPFDVQMTAARPAWKAWCEAHLTLVETYSFTGRTVSLYQRRELPLSPAQPVIPPPS